MKILIIFFLIACCFINFSFAQQTAEKLFEVKGIVKNQDRDLLAGMNLYFQSGESKQAIVSDENGAFIAKLPVGKYKITANAAVSENFAAFIEIADGNLNPNDFELIVETNKSCCDQMSDGNATEVVKYFAPPYPAPARAVRAMGEVVVAVKIDKEGKVVSAEAESGHPLLRKASEQAARGWTFSSDDAGKEREGKIVFAFIEGNEQKENIFLKPNRLEIFSIPLVISSTRSYQNR